MLSLKAVKPGKIIDLDTNPYLVLSAQHSKQARGGAVLKTKLKNIVSGEVINRAFQGNDKLEEANLDEIKTQYLYSDGKSYYFMNQENYEQFSLDSSQVGSAKNYLKEETIVTIRTYNDKPISIKLPVKMNFKVTKAEPGVRGNTAQNANKTVEIETGLRVSVPLFINGGEMIKINTETGEYVERVKS